MSHIWSCICIFLIFLTIVILSVISSNFLHWTVFSFFISFHYFLVTLWKTFEIMTFFDSKGVHTLSFLALLLLQVTIMLWTQLVEKQRWQYFQLPTTQAASYTWSTQTLWWPDMQTEFWWRLDVKLMRVCMLPKICAMLTWPIILSLANNPRT